MKEYNGWKIGRKIGSGSFGNVYEIEKEDFGYQYKAALKIISIPNSKQDSFQLKNNADRGEGSLEAYYESVVSEIVKELELMYRLRGISNIVSYEDHEIRKHENGIGWDIMIRMELLTPLDVYKKNHPLSRKDIIQLGIDMCKALERCRMYHIIHRDIKPANIFVSDQGDFKLGDFGIARTIESHEAVLELSRKGTINYMAPEIVKGGKYDFTVDIYSLGVVMYRYLNQNTLPFVPLPPAELTYKDIEKANQRRLGGEELPYPVGDHTQLADVVRKACSYRPQDRYQSPGQMREHLEKLLKGDKVSEFDDETILLPEQEDRQGKKRSKRKKILAVCIVIGIVLAAVGIAANTAINFSKENNKEEMSEDEEEIQSEEEKDQNAESELKNLISQRDFVSSYKLIQDAVQNGENVDKEIQMFVLACEEELEYKRAAAAMKLLSGNVMENETFYIETIQWFSKREQDDLARQILSDLRAKGEEGAKLADSISLE